MGESCLCSVLAGQARTRVRSGLCQALSFMLIVYPSSLGPGPGKDTSSLGVADLANPLQGAEVKARPQLVGVWHRGKCWFPTLAVILTVLGSHSWSYFFHPRIQSCQQVLLTDSKVCPEPSPLAHIPTCLSPFYSCPVQSILHRAARVL